jgi:hypothetical protein
VQRKSVKINAPSSTPQSGRKSDITINCPLQKPNETQKNAPICARDHSFQIEIEASVNKNNVAHFPAHRPGAR